MKYIRNERGLTLVEVIASLVILSIALLLLSNFLVRSFELSSDQDSRMVAMNLARQVAEEWRSGNGTIKNSSIVTATGFSGDSDIVSLSTKDGLLFADIKLLCEKISVSSTPDYEIALPAVEVNERIYQPKVSLSFYPSSSVAASDPASTLVSDPMILIIVRVNDNNNRILATLETSVNNPRRGGP